jgi:hypothetical protein
MPTLPRSDTAPALRRTTAIAGLATFVLQFGGQALMQVNGQEPAFDAPAAEISAFFAAVDPDLFAAGSYLSVLSVLTVLWFFGGLYALLREDWRAPVALVCGVAYATGAGVGWELAAFRTREGIDPQLARLAFDLGNLSFAAAWVALGGFTLAVGWSMLTGPYARPRLGWWAIATGVALVAARAIWTTSWWLLGYASFWLWAIVVCVLLLRRTDLSAPRSSAAPRSEPSRP